MTLTSEQKLALEHGEAVPLTLDGTECVVVRREVFERLRRVEYEDSDLSELEMRAVAARTFEEADTAGPIS